MTLESIMRGFLSIPHAIVGNGPRHPIQPDQKLESELAAYFDRYPFLFRIDEYRQFLEEYGGAGVFYLDNVRPAVVLDIFGIGRFAEDNELLDADGFFCFATCTIDYDASKSATTSYFFDSRNPELNLVYRRRYDESVPDGGGMRVAFPSFLEWLAAVVRSNGFLQMQDT